MKTPKSCPPARRASLASVALFATLLATGSAYAADVTKLSTGGLSAGSSWDGNAVPGSANTALFNSTSVPTSDGANFDASGTSSALTWGGMKVTDIQGNLTIDVSGGSPVTIGSGGIDMSLASKDVAFTTGSIRFAGSSTLNVASSRTLTIQNSTTSANSNITLSGGGTLVLNGSFSGGNRLSLNVANGTLAGIGTYTPHNTNVGFGIRVQSGSFVAPGDGGIGTLTIDSSGTSQTILQMDSGSGFKFDLGSGGTVATPGTSDLLVFTNSAADDVVFNDNTIDFLGSGEVGVYKLFDGLAAADDADTWSGLSLSGQTITAGLIVTNLASGLEGSLILGDGVNFGDLGDIYLQVTSAIPEPATCAFLAGLVTLGFIAVRRRRA